MKLSAREAAALLNVSETKIYRLVDEGEIPFTVVHHHPLFHRVELLEWAMSNEIQVSAAVFEDGDAPLAVALEHGGGKLLGDSLARIADDLPIENPVDRDLVRSVIEARASEMFASRGPSRIAIPRARSPIICPSSRPAVMLWWCGRRHVLGDAAISALFVIVAPTIHRHLQLLSRLSYALHDDAFVAAVQRDGAITEVIAEVRRIELAIAARAMTDERAQPAERTP